MSDSDASEERIDGNARELLAALVALQDAHRAWLLDVSNDAAASNYRAALAAFGEADAQRKTHHHE